MDGMPPAPRYIPEGRGKGLFRRHSPETSGSSSEEDKFSSDGPSENPPKRIKYATSEMSRVERRDLRWKLKLEVEQVEHAHNRLYYWDQIHKLGRHLGALRNPSSFSSTVSSGVRGEGKIKDKVLRLQTSDGRVFEVAGEVASHSEIILKIMTLVEQFMCPQYTAKIPLALDVSSRALAMVIDYCEYNVKEYIDDVDKKNRWNEAFAHILQNEASTFLDVMRVAVSLEMEHLIKKCRNYGSSHTIGEIREASKRSHGLCTVDDPTWKLILQSLF